MCTEVNVPCVVRNFGLVHTSSVTFDGMHRRLIIGSVPPESNRHLKTNLSFTCPMRNPVARICGTASSSLLSGTYRTSVLDSASTVAGLGNAGTNGS